MILLGLVWGLGVTVIGESGVWIEGFEETESFAKFAIGFGWLWEMLRFFGRVIGTCAVFYGFFLCRMLGAGDIKLMAVCVGILGIWHGVCLIFAGMSLALLAACFRGKIWKYGLLHMKNQELRLAPYLFAGYCLVRLLNVI